jgi:protein gp37
LADQRKGGIAWTDETWNPLRGCSPSMPCAPRCWAAQMAHRQAGLPGYDGFTDASGRWTGRVSLIESQLYAPLRWKRHRRIAVGLMGDLFRLPFEQIDRIFAVMALCPQHTFQCLTKQPARMLEYFAEKRGHFTCEYKPGYSISRLLPVHNVHLGLSCMNQTDVDRDVPILLQTPAAARWLSLEPLMGPINLYTYLPTLEIERESGMWRDLVRWVVVGGESGPGARPMHPDWVRSIRDQCSASGVPFMFKQWGEWLPIATPRMTAKVGETLIIDGFGNTRPASWGDVMQSRGDLWAVERVGKKSAGHLLDGREHLAFPA